MTTTKKYPVLATAEEIRMFARRASVLVESLDDNDNDDSIYGDAEATHREHVIFRAAKETMRFCAAAAALLGDASLLQTIGDMLEEQAHWNDDAESDSVVIAQGFGELLRRGAPVTDLVSEFASHKSEYIRAAIAGGLRPNSDRAIALLEKLAADPIAHVRMPARAALASRGEVAWWAGKFTSDPLANLSEEDAARLREPIEAISTILDRSRWKLREGDIELAGLVAQLPDALAIDVVERVLASGDMYSALMPHIGADMLSREGGVEALIRVIQQWKKGRVFFLHGDYHLFITKLPAPRATEVCLALAKYALQVSEALRDDTSSTYTIAAELAARGLPPDADRAPYIDMLLAVPPTTGNRSDYVVSKLSEVLSSAANPGPYVERLIEARLANYPGAWGQLGHAIDATLTRAPLAFLRPAAETALRSDDDNVATWGIGTLMEAAYQLEVDGTRVEFATRLYEDPRIRTLILKNAILTKRVFAPLRAALRRGELDFNTTVSVFRSIQEFWGGIISPYVTRAYANDEEKVEAARAATREKFGDSLGPEELHGPVTEEEWDHLRRVRESVVLTDDPPWMNLLCTLPEGPWHEADRALLDRAVVFFEKEPRIYFPLTLCLSGKATIAELPIFERMLALMKKDRGFIRSTYYETRERLGLPAKPEATGGGESVAKDWLDEDDD